MEMGKQNSRTLPGLFNFQGLNFFPQREKCTFYSQKRRNEKAHSISLILTPVIKTGTTAQIE